MLPKDLLVDLESGDRTKEHLEAKEVPVNQWGAQSGGLVNALNMHNHGLANQLGAMQQQHQGFSQQQAQEWYGSIVGGIRQGGNSQW